MLKSGKRIEKRGKSREQRAKNEEERGNRKEQRERRCEDKKFGMSESLRPSNFLTFSSSNDVNVFLHLSIS
jgi:hypothetical protein